MPDILPTEIVTLLIGMVSIGAADLVYHNGTINQRITHRLIRPFHPQTNSMVERFNRRLGEHLEQRP